MRAEEPIGEPNNQSPSSNKLQFTPKSEESTNSSINSLKVKSGSPRPQRSFEKRGKLRIVDSKSAVAGVGILLDKIFCILSDRPSLFIYQMTDPFNSMTPQQVVIRGLKEAKDLVVCSKTKSVFVCDQESVFRFYPQDNNVATAENRLCRGKVIGGPMTMGIDGMDEERILVGLQRSGQLHVVVYNTKNCRGDDGRVKTEVTLQEIRTIDIGNKVTLPFSVCVSGLPAKTMSEGDSATKLDPDSKHICVMFLANEHKLTHYELNTGQANELKVPLRGQPRQIVTNKRRGGVYVLLSDQDGGILPANHALELRRRLLTLDSTNYKLCFNDEQNKGVIGLQLEMSPHLLLLSRISN